MNNKYIFSLIIQLNTPYEYFREFRWLNKQYYHIYLRKFHTIIEINNNTQLDKYKKAIAIKNNMSNYITTKEEVKSLFNINFEECEEYSKVDDETFIIDLYKTKLEVKKISIIVGMNKGLVRKIIKKFNSI